MISDRVSQDQARDAICGLFEALGCACRVIDRRLTPSHGYRAVHLIVVWDGIPVEIQVRTELQDTWAQIVERMGDRWGRGLRYGEDPEDPDAPIAPGVSATRRDAMEIVGDLGNLIAWVEERRAGLAQVQVMLAEMSRRATEFEQVSTDDDRVLGESAPMELVGALDRATTDALLPEVRDALIGWRNMTPGEVATAFRLAIDAAGQAQVERVAELEDNERRLHDTLQRIAGLLD